MAGNSFAECDISGTAGLLRRTAAGLCLYAASLGAMAQSQAPAQAAAAMLPCAPAKGGAKEADKLPAACAPGRPAATPGSQPDRLMTALRLIYIHGILPR